MPKSALRTLRYVLVVHHSLAHVLTCSLLQQYKSLVDAEWRILYEKMEKMVESGAHIILSKLPIGDVATQYFADRDLFCAGRVAEAVRYTRKN
jgi:chaperonin GroEL (HSP60 family)